MHRAASLVLHQQSVGRREPRFYALRVPRGSAEPKAWLTRRPVPAAAGFQSRTHGTAVDHPHTGILFAHSAAQGGRSGGLVILSSCHSVNSVMVAGAPEKGCKSNTNWAQATHDRTSSSVIAPRFPKIKGVATNFAPNGMTERPHPVMGSGVPKKR